MEDGLINGKNHWTSEFDNGKYGIWWAPSDAWQIGSSSSRGKNSCFMYTMTDNQCVHDALWNWKFFDTSDNKVAAEKSLSVWCQSSLNPDLFNRTLNSIKGIERLHNHTMDETKDQGRS